MKSYHYNQVVKVSNSFYVDSVLTDPTTVTLKVMNPAGTTSTYTYAAATVTKTSTGIYYKNVTASSEGLWSYRWEGTGAVEATDEGQFWVKATVFA